MGYPTKVQLIQRKKGPDQWYINFPTAIAEAMDFEKGEVVLWHIEDRANLVLHRQNAKPAPVEAKKKTASLYEAILKILEQAPLASKEKLARRGQAHVLAQLACLGSKTVTGLITTLGGQQDDWTADYRLYAKDRIDPKALLRTVREEIRQEGEDVVCALDDTHLRKTGKKTYGVKYARDPMGPPFHTNFVRAQRFIQISVAARDENQNVRMIPADWKHAPTPPKPKKKDEASMEKYRKERREKRLALQAAKMVINLKAELDASAKPYGKLWVCHDGSYANRTFLAPMPDDVIACGRIRHDAKLYYLPEKQKEKGRKRAYGEQAPTPNALRQDESVPWETAQVRIGDTVRDIQYKRLNPVKWKPTGQHKTVQVLALKAIPYKLSKNSPLNRRTPISIICTDPQADPQTIIQRYIWRWEIEVNFRDEKTILGVGETQVRKAPSVQNTTALAVAAYAVLLAAALKQNPQTQADTYVQPPKWQNQKPKRTTTMHLLQNLRMQIIAHSIHFSDFVLDQLQNTKPQKCTPHILSAIKYASRYT